MNRGLSRMIACWALSQAAHAQLPSFPGAEGFGSTATGGRGGDVYYVTKRNASGAGSFADAVTTAPTAGRTIVFAVSGHIRLPSGSGGGLSIAKNKITVAGQTAPGDGIAFWNNTMNLTGNDIVLRHLRWRYGKQTAGGDSVDIANSQRIILDHCDVMFSTDENLSSFGTPPEFFTFQWSVNAWGLSGHSCGGLWDINHATAHHTLWANNHTRNPKCISPSVFDWVNNVTFGWDYGFNMAASTDPIARVNIRGSYFIHGGNTTEAVYGGGLNASSENIFKLHMSDSALDGSANGILDVTRTNYGMVNSSSYDQTATAWPQTIDGVTGGTFIGTPVSLDTRRTAHKKVLSQAGATRMEIGTRPLRDEITQLCVDRTAAMQRGIISDPLELSLTTGTAFADLQSTTAPLDTDLDGMPDAWEEAVGYNKAVPNNNAVLTAPELAASYFPAGSPVGYTQLEEYLHFMAVPHGTVAKNTAASPTFIDIDLRKFTSGFTASPVFTLSNIVGGTATQSGPGNAIVRFIPTLETSGRAGFLFTVTDSTGDTWTQQCCLLVSTQPQPRPVTWVGDGVTNNWDTTTANFTSLVGTTPFVSGDAVTINDSGSNTPTLKLTGALGIASLTVSNSSKNFTLEGTGSLTGTGGLNKSGTGTLTLRVPNSATGSGLIDGGTVILGGPSNIGSLPSGQLTLQKNATITNAWPSSGSTQNITAPLFIPAGETTTIQTGRRIQLSGAVTGEGTLNIVHQGTDNVVQFRGAMNSFAGNLNFTYTGTNPGMSVVFNGASFNGWSAATVQFPAPLSLSCTTNSTGNTFGIGELTGSGTLGGGSAGSPNYTIGGLNTDSTFSGSFSGNAKLTKTGTGTLTVSGNSTHTGATAINSGALHLTGTFGASPVSVSAGAVLSGTGTMGGALTTTAGAILSPGANNGSSAGTLTAASLNLTSPTLRFDLSSNPVSGNDRIQVSGGGAIALSANVNFIFNLTDGILSSGTYDLITTTSTLTATSVTLTSNLPAGSRQTLTLEHHAAGIRLVVSGSNANLTWTGNNGGLWDQQTTASWSGASPATFFNFDNVLFDDTATNGAVSMTQPVAPQSLTVNNSTARAYTFTGAPITGSSSLVKSGSGTLTLNIPQYTLTNCSITTGSPTVTVSSTANLLPGMTVSGTGIPADATIVSVVNATTFTLSQNATATSSATTLTIETRNTYSGGTLLNGGAIILTSNASPSSTPSAPANPYGLGTGPITFNGGSLTLHGHTGVLTTVHGALPNDLIVPAGQTGNLFDTVRGLNTVPYSSLGGSLTGSGTLNLTVNYYRSSITGDWSAFAGTLNVKRPVSGANDPRIQFGGNTGLPLATVNLEQVRMEYTGTPPAEGITIPIGSLSGISSAVISGSQNVSGTVIWQVGSLNTSTTFAGNFTPFNNYPIGLEKTGTGTWTLTGTGTVSAGINVAQGTLSYGDAAADTLAGTSEFSVDSGATLQLNSGAKITGAGCEIFSGGTLRGRGTLQAPLSSSGTVSVIGGTLAIIGDATLNGSLAFSSLSDRLALTGNLSLAGQLALPSSGLTTGRKLLITHSGTLATGEITITNLPTNLLARLDTATTGEIAVRLIDSAAYQSWQITHFGNTTNPDGQPTADPDSDGITNFEEYENNTNPNDHLPLVLTISSNDATKNFSSLNSTYTGGVLNWTNGGLLTNRAVQRLILDTTLNGGTIDMGASTNVLTLTTGEIQFLGGNNLTLTGGQLGAANSAVSLTTAGSNTLTLSSPISSGTGSLSVFGTANVILNTANTFTGGLTLNGGLLKQGVANALGSANGTLTLNSGTVDLNGIATGFGILTGSGGSITSATPATLTLGNNNGTNGNFAGTIDGGIALSLTGTSYTKTATLSGSNTYSGATTLGVTSGSLAISNNSALGNTPSIDIAGGGAAIILADGITITGKPITIRGSGANNGTAGSFSGSLTTAANAAATWIGSITLGDGNSRLGSGNSGVLTVTGPILGSGANQSISLSSGTGSTLGTVVLSGANSFTGNISIVRGSLKPAASNTLPATAVIDVGSASIPENTTFDLNGFSQTLAGLKRTSTNTTQLSTVTNSSATAATLTLNQSTALSYSGRISGNLTLAKSGTGTLTLSNTNALASTLTLMLDGGAISLSSPHTITALRINGVWQAPGTYTAANSSGRISGAGSLIVTSSGPTGFTSWIAGFPGLSDTTPLGDPDADGVCNLLEYALIGNPNSRSNSILPATSATATHYLFTFTQREESATSTTQTFEYGSTLGAWTSLNITAPAGAGVSFGSSSAGARLVTVSIPKSAAPGGRIFGRLKVAQP